MLWRRDSGVVAHNPTHPTPLHSFRIFLSSFHDQCVLITVLEPRERDTPYNGQYGEAPPERGTFFWLQVYKREGILLVELYERAGKFVLFSLKKPVRANKCILWLWESRKRSSFVVYSSFKESACSLNREYYTVARRYEFYVREARTISHE